MRSTSSRRRTVAILLSIALAFQWALLPAAEAMEAAEPALLLKFAAPDIPEGSSREMLDPISGKVSRQVRVRWVAVPVETTAAPVADSRYPIPDDAVLRKISEKISRATRHMERVENKAAGRLLAEAEREARGCRFTEATLPFFAEIFLKEGILKLRAGDVPAAESMFSRSRALRPGFVPDPALFPPQVVAAWGRAARRPMPEAELLVQSVPSGAAISVDGAYAGKTPSRVRPGKVGPVKIRVSHKGYRDADAVGQWLPGDAETLDFALAGDRVARLGDLLSEGEGKRGKGAGPLIDEFAAAAGVRRVAIVTLEKHGSGEGYIARAYANGAVGADPVFLGEMRLSPEDRETHAAGEWLAGKLVDGGWPPERKDPEAKPWYKSWWVWGMVVAAAAGIAVALGGGGSGSSGSSDSSIAVNF